MSNISATTAKMRYKLATQFTTDALIKLVISTGIASDPLTSIIQEQALNVLEEKLSEYHFLEVLTEVDLAIDNGIDCTLRSILLKPFGQTLII